MPDFAEPLARLIQELKRLPGIGQKSAQRIAFHVLRVPREDAERLAQAVVDVKDKLGICTICNNISDAEVCNYCRDTHRDHTLICVVEEPHSILAYDALLNQLSADEAVIFADAVHPTHAVRPVGCWAPKEVAIAVEQSSGRDRLNIHGAVDLETGQTIMKDVLSVDALSTILLLTAIEALYPGMRLIHVFLDNARYHHAKLVQAWLTRPDCRIRLHFVPAYCPHLNPIERLWGLMHRHTTHNKCYATFREFSAAMLAFLREDVPANWREWCDQVTDNFRVINPKEFRIIA